MSLRVWWLAFIGGLAVLVLIAISIARMYAPRTAPSDAPVANAPTTPKETAHITATLFSADVARGHPGGSLNELLTVYAIVNAVSANLPAARRVQILIDGKEADTIAGHVDLRRPLTRNDSLVRETDEK